MLKILQNPFPLFLSKKGNLLSAFLFGFFVFFFLQVFQPFGLSGVRGQLWQVTVTYGLITFFVIVFMELLIIPFFPKFYNEEEWTIGKEILHVMITIFIISLGNFIYSSYLNFFDFSPEVFGEFIGYTMAIAIFPVTVQILIRQNLLQKKYIRESEFLNSRLHPKGENKKSAEHLEANETLQLKDENGSMELELDPADLLAVESADNYVNLYYLVNGELKKKMIRNSVKSIEEQIRMGEFFRCHRSWLVNLRKIDKVKGNARGYRLSLNPAIPEIPVARRRTEEFETMVRG